MRILIYHDNRYTVMYLYIRISWFLFNGHIIMFRYGFEYHYECSKMFNVYMYNSLITVILNLCRFNIVYTQYFKLLPYNIQLIFEKKDYFVYQK